MLSLFNFPQLIPGVLTSIVGGVLLSIGSYALFKIYLLIKVRKVRDFWYPFIKEDITIRFTEYKPEYETSSPSDATEEYPTNSQLDIAERAGGQLMTRGMAMGVNAVLDYYHNHGIPQFGDQGTPYIRGSHDTTPNEDRRIILGSQVSNRYAENLYNRINERFDMPVCIDKELTFCHKMDNLVPDLQNGDGTDYAMVVRTSIEGTDYLWIAGCHMYGTQAAAEVVTDPEFMNKVIDRAGKTNDFMFAIQTNVQNGWPIDKEILKIEGEQIIQDIN